MLLLLLLFAAVFWFVMYKFTIYALPCLIGVSAGQLAYATGAGWLGSAIVSIVVAILTFAVLRWSYLNASTPIRWLVAAAFVLTTAAFAYFLFDDISRGNVPSEIWRQVLCVFGAGVAGLIAFVRLSEITEQAG